jgi:hypothetical protein
MHYNINNISSRQYSWWSTHPTEIRVIAFIVFIIIVIIVDVLTVYFTALKPTGMLVFFFISISLLYKKLLVIFFEKMINFEIILELNLISRFKGNN